MRVTVFQTLTGQPICELPHTAATCTSTLNDPGQITVSVPLGKMAVKTAVLMHLNPLSVAKMVEDAQGLDLRNATTLGMASIAVEDEATGLCLGGGPIIQRKWNPSTGILDLTAQGLMGGYLAHRLVLPPAAMTQPLTLTTGAPDTTLDTTFTGLSWRTIAKRIVQQALSWPGAGLPMIYEDDVAGTNHATYAAVGFNVLATVLGDIEARADGCDIQITCERTVTGGFTWRLRTGGPRLASTVDRVWDLSATMSPFSDLLPAEDSTSRADLNWLSGGRSSDNVLISKAQTPTLVNAGAPLTEAVDSSHSDVIDQATLDAWAAEDARTGWLPVEAWTVNVNIAVIPLTEFTVGDWVELVVGNDPFTPDGTYRRRIASIQVTEGNPLAAVTMASAYDG